MSFGPENRLLDWIREAEGALPGLAEGERQALAQEARLKAQRVHELQQEFAGPAPPGGEEVAEDLREAFGLFGHALEALEREALGHPREDRPPGDLAAEADDLLHGVDHRVARLQATNEDWTA